MRYNRQKFYAKKTEFNGITFDSRKECERYQTLLWMEQNGYISDLRRQVRFNLLPAQREPDIEGPRGAKYPGRLLERAVDYIADFVYTEDGKTVVEDSKGFRTPEYRIKRKMMLYFHGIQIRET